MKKIFVATLLGSLLTASYAGTLIVSGGSVGPASGLTSAPAGAPPSEKKSQVWDVRVKDVSFSSAFTRWAKDAGYTVRWDARKHAMVDGPDQITGTFEDAIAKVLGAPGIAQSDYPLEVCFYPNTPPLARITRKGEQDKECK